MLETNPFTHLFSRQCVLKVYLAIIVRRPVSVFMGRVTPEMAPAHVCLVTMVTCVTGPALTVSMELGAVGDASVEKELHAII